jgi:hypothetical protein
MQRLLQTIRRWRDSPEQRDCYLAGLKRCFGAKWKGWRSQSPPGRNGEFTEIVSGVNVGEKVIVDPEITDGAGELLIRN